MLEMKVTLYLFWRLSRVANGANGSSPHMVSLGEMEGSDSLRFALSLCKGPRSFGEALREGLELCVSRGTLLQLLVREETTNGHASETSERWYIFNTKENRVWVGALAQGEIDVTATPLWGEQYGTTDSQHPVRSHHRAPQYLRPVRAEYRPAHTHPGRAIAGCPSGATR